MASDFAFTGPPTMPSGWNTIRLHNEGEETHFLTFWELPEGITFDHYTGQPLPAFFEVFGPYVEGELPREELVPAIRAGLPDWFADVVNRGGPGLTAPGVTSETTVHLPAGTTSFFTVTLEPGRYALVSKEYAARGMVLEFRVE